MFSLWLESSFYCLSACYKGAITTRRIFQMHCHTFHQLKRTPSACNLKVRLHICKTTQEVMTTENVEQRVPWSFSSPLVGWVAVWFEGGSHTNLDCFLHISHAFVITDDWGLTIHDPLKPVTTVVTKVIGQLDKCSLFTKTFRKTRYYTIHLSRM